MQAIAGFDPQDPGSEDIAVPDYAAELNGGVRGLRLGLLLGLLGGFAVLPLGERSQGLGDGDRGKRRSKPPFAELRASGQPQACH
ncbi:Glutamyl-tRNA(Gln) amidotransferase subunit A [compost metagenome]